MCLEDTELGYCYECDEHPDCSMYNFMQRDCLKRGENLMENLARIQAGKIEEWLE